MLIPIIPEALCVMLNTEQIIEIAKGNALAFVLGYLLATGELHLLIADLLSL